MNTVFMSALIRLIGTVLGQSASVLADLKATSRSQANRAQAEFPFGAVSEFDYNASVRFKASDRKIS